MKRLSGRSVSVFDDPAPEQPARPLLGRQVGRGAIWALSANLTMRLASIAVTALLARLLSPGDFGVFAIALAVYLVVSSLAELGMASAIARSPEPPDDIAPTVVSISLLVSVGLGVLMAFGAGPLADLLGQPAAAAPIRILSLSMVLTGAFAVPGAQLVREFRQDRIFFATITGFVVSNPLLVILALHGGGVAAFAWSRVIGQLATGLVLYFSTSQRYRPGWRRSVIKPLLLFGAPLTLANLVSWSLLNADYIILGRLVDNSAVGVYTIAFNVASWSTAILGAMLNSVVVPALGRMRDDPSKLAGALVRGCHLVALVAFPIGGLTMVLADPLIRVVFGTRWTSAGPVLMILAVYGVLFTLSLLFSNVLVATGRTVMLLLIQIAWIVGLVPAMIVGVHYIGLAGAAWAHVLIIALVSVPAYLLAIRKATSLQMSTLVGTLTRPMFGTTIASGAAWVISTSITGPVAVRLIAAGSVGVLVYVFIIGPSVIRTIPDRFRPAWLSHRWGGTGRERRIPQERRDNLGRHSRHVLRPTDRERLLPMKVMIVSHEASRTGAPRVAVLVGKCLTRQGHTVQFVCRSKGPLFVNFEEVARTSMECLYRVRRRLRKIRGLRTATFFFETAMVTASLLARRPDLVYINSTSASIYVRPALWLRLRVVLHVHESGKLAELFVRQAHMPPLPEHVSCIGCSPSVRSEFAALIGREEGAVSMLPSVPDEPAVLRLSEEPVDHDYRSDELVVGCCGTVESRKGADLWAAAAERVKLAMPGQRVRFVWVGEAREAIPPHDQDVVEFIGPRDNPYAHMKRFDVATLPSRDDPFPLVVLEAMLLGTPVVAFGVGSVSEQIGCGGVIVPSGDVDAFAQAIVRLLSDADLRKRLGSASKCRVEKMYSLRAFNAGLTAVIDGSYVDQGDNDRSFEFGEGAVQ